MMEDLEENKRDNLLIEVLRWLLRFAIAAAALWLLFYADKAVVERVASWTSVVFTVGTFYIVTLEPELLGLLIERARRIFGRRKKARTDKRRRRRWKFGRDQQDQAHEDAFSGVEDGDFDPSEIRKVSEVENRAKTVGTENSHPAQPIARIGLLSAGVASLYVMAVIVGDALGRFGAPGETTAVSPDTSPGIPEIPNLDQSAATAEPAQPIQPPAASVSVQVNSGDSCYSIAIACTGNGERFVELGPPTNAWLDVSDRNYCLIRPNDMLTLPQNWPTDCASANR